LGEREDWIFLGSEKGKQGANQGGNDCMVEWMYVLLRRGYGG